MQQKALTGRRILDCSQFVTGPYCARVLADVGAEVIKVEPPSGDISRTSGPFPGHTPDPEKSALFLYNNFNKLGVTLNLENPKGQDVFKKLVKDADILIEDNPPGKMEEAGLGYETLQEINPALIMASITPFGLTGPHKDYEANYLTIFHSSGLGAITPPEPQWGKKILEREPCREGGYSGEYDCAMVAAIGVMAALFARWITGKGQFIEMSKQEMLMQMSRVPITGYNELGISQHRDDIKYRLNFNYLYPCKDGWVALMHNQPHHWNALMKLMGNPEWSKDPRMSDSTRRIQEVPWPEYWEKISEWTKNQNKTEVGIAYQELGGPGGPCWSLSEFITLCPQIKERGFLIEIEHPKAGKLPYPSTFSKYGSWPWEARCPAPLLGQHNEEIYCRRLGFSKQGLTELREEGIV